MEELYRQFPENGVNSEMRQIFIYAAFQDMDKLPELAQKICDGKTGVKCLVKWISPMATVDEEDLRINLSNSQVLLVLVTPSLISDIREHGLPLPVKIMRDTNHPYFPVATVTELLEDYCALDRPLHGVSQDDNDFLPKLKEQLRRYILDEEFVKAIQEKAFIDQIFMSYRKIDSILTKNLMDQIHSLPNFEAVSIWYDRFLTAGKEFNDEIFAAIDNSSVFTMVITPNIIKKRDNGKDNFVVSHEYPYAKEKKRQIVPLNTSGCNLSQLRLSFDGIAKPVDIDEAHTIFLSAMAPLPDADSYSSERLYYLGNAYNAGYFVEQNLERAIGLYSRSTGGLDEYALKSAVRLAEMYELGSSVGGIDYQQALLWRNRASKISEIVLGTEHPDTASTYNNVACVYDNQGDYTKALEWYQKALVVREKVLGTEHPDTAMSYNHIALVHSRQRDYAKALEWHQKALVIREKVLGTEHPSTATTYNNIALAYSYQGDVVRALEWYQKALTISEKALGTEHPDTATTYNNIASVYSQQGNNAKALEWYQKALAIFERELGHEHPNAKIVRDNMKSIPH